MASEIWTEKYRPKDFSEIKGQKEIVKRVKAFVEQQNIPHLLFASKLTDELECHKSFATFSESQVPM